MQSFWKHTLLITPACACSHLPPPICASPPVYTSSVGKETCVTVAVLSVWPIIIEATKSLNKGGKESVPLFPWNEPWKV
jgi:hypothetical protein